jgi:cell division septation protein DedD
MRDLDRWKDKVELSLDGRQIFFLFFGSAVGACLIFVLGVLIGKRLEARALALSPAPVEDPLAALDQLGEADDANDGLTFHKALTHDKDKKSTEPMASMPEPKPAIAAKPEPGKADGARADAARVDGAKASARVDGNRSDGEKPEAAQAAGAKVAVRPEAAKPEANKIDGARADAAKPTAKPEVAAAKPAAPLPAGKPQVVAAAAAAAPGAKKPDPASSRFTLQLSAFPEKSDAEEFMKKIQAAGYKPFLVSSEVPGKGLFYRVRVGDYATRQAALDAKGEFERKQRLIAYVAKL